MTLHPRAVDRLRRAMAVMRTPGAAKLLANPWRQTRSRLLESFCLHGGITASRAATTFWGERMQVVYPELVSVAIDRYGFFESEVTLCLIERLKPGMTFFDVGAHFGFFTLLASQLVGSSGQVHAFEPTPSTFAVLRRNAAGHANVTLTNAAAYSRATTLTFRDFGTAFSAFNTLHGGKIEPSDRERAEGRAKTVDVSGLSLDEYVERSGTTPDLLKVDTEGAELDVLLGMKSLLSGKFGARPTLTLEVGDVGSPPGTSQSRRVVDATLQRGYRALEFNNGIWRPHVPRASYTYTNLLFEPIA